MRQAIILSVLLCGAVAGAVPQLKFFARRDYTGLHSTWVQVADTNGDGVPDLIASETGYIQVLLGNGNGTFSSGPNSNTIMSSIAFVAADLNGDGKVDLVQGGNTYVGGGYQYGVGVSLGNGDGTFQFGLFYQVSG